MKQLSVDIPELYSKSIRQIKKYASFIIGISTTYWVLAVVPQIYFFLRMPEDPAESQQFLSFILTAVQLYLGIGFIKIMLRLAQEKYVHVIDLFNNIRIFLSYFVGSFLYGAGVIIGLFLLVIPGIWVAVRFALYPYYIIEYNDTSFIALKKSFETTRNYTLDVFLFGVTVLLLNLLGALFLGIGVLITYPLTTLATAYLYLIISKQSNSDTPNSIPENT